MKKEHPAPDLLTILAPPIRLVDWLEQVFEAKRKAGEAVPVEYMAWLDLWKQIRADGASEIDGSTPAQWEQLRMKMPKKAAA